MDIEALHPDSDDDNEGMDVDETLYFGPTARTLFYEKYRQLSYLLNQETSISACHSASFQSYKTVAASARPQSALSFTSLSKSISATRTELMGYSFPSITRFTYFLVPHHIHSHAFSSLPTPLISSPTPSHPFPPPLTPFHPLSALDRHHFDHNRPSVPPP